WKEGLDLLSAKQARSLFRQAGGLPDEEVLQLGQAIYDTEAEIALGAERPEIVREQAVQDVGGRAHLEGIEAAPELVALQHVDRADVLAETIRLDDHFGKGCCIAEAEIEALAGDRMDAVCGIASQREARLDEVAGERQPEREGTRLVEDADLAELVAEAGFELGLENDLVFLNKALGVFRPCVPDNRRAVAALFVVGERQDRERACREKMLLGAAPMRALMRDGADDAGLAVFPVDSADASHLAQARAHAVG